MVIAAEGARTEREYFGLLKVDQSRFTIKIIKGGDQSSPPRLLERMQNHLCNNPPRKGDQAWLVLDRDDWPERQLNALFSWTMEDPNHRHLAVSNPCFEYWLLLHLESGSKGVTRKGCRERLVRHLPDYDKGIRPANFTESRVRQAVGRARDREHQADEGWPRMPGSTTVYRLVEQLYPGSKGKLIPG